MPGMLICGNAQNCGGSNGQIDSIAFGTMRQLQLAVKLTF